MDEKNKTIEERQAKDKEAILEQLRKMPVNTYACERAGISRATFYRWLKDDADFKKAADTATQEGELLINDMSESQLIVLIREKKLPAIALWLKQHHPKYATRVEVVTKQAAPEEKLTSEQEALVKRALELSSFHYGKEQNSTE